MPRTLSHTEIQAAASCEARPVMYLVTLARELRAGGKTYEEIAREMGFDAMTIHRWVNHKMRYIPRVTPFWDRMTRPGPDACWEWQGASHPAGYGQITIEGHRVYAHRHAFELVCGPIPVGLLLLHSCDNPPCCNPKHLRPGTVKDNARDAMSRDRLARQRGENHGACKFTDALLEQARALRREGKLLREISGLTGIEQSYLSRICRGASR